MIGVRIPVESDRFDYVFGLLADEGLVGDVDFMPTGGAEMVIRDEAWHGLDGEIREEIARFIRPGGDVVVVQPADDDGSDTGATAVTQGSPRSPRSAKEHNSKGA